MNSTYSSFDQLGVSPQTFAHHQRALAWQEGRWDEALAPRLSRDADPREAAEALEQFYHLQEVSTGRGSLQAVRLVDDSDSDTSEGLSLVSESATVPSAASSGWRTPPGEPEEFEEMPDP